MKHETLLEIYDPKKNLGNWQERYPEISKIQIEQALREVSAFVQSSTIPPSARDTERLFGLKMGQLLLERRMIIKKLRKHSTLKTYVRNYPDIPKKELKDVLYSVSKEIEEGTGFYISSSTGFSLLNRRLADLNSHYVKIKEASSALPESQTHLEKPTTMLFLSIFAQEYFRKLWFLGPAGAAAFCNLSGIVIANANTSRAVEAMRDPWIVIDALLAFALIAGAVHAKKRTSEIFSEKTIGKKVHQ